MPTTGKPERKSREAEPLSERQIYARRARAGSLAIRQCRCYVRGKDLHSKIGLGEPKMSIQNASNFARTVLLVDPHVPTRMAVRNALAQHGYRVIQARDGMDALAASEAIGGPVHVLITELVLPDMDGLRLARRLATRSPYVRLLIHSADCQDVYFLHPSMAHRAAFLRKPCEPRSLVNKVGQMFNRAAKSAGS